jgi:hypothetical protein
VQSALCSNRRLASDRSPQALACQKKAFVTAIVTCLHRWKKKGLEILTFCWMNFKSTIARPENIASQRVMQKVGFKYENNPRYYETDVVYYSISRSQYSQE